MMRSNRLFGANLVEHNLIDIEALETANTRFLDTVGTPGSNGLPRHLLHVLLYDTQSLVEDKLLAHQAEELSLGIVDMRHIEPHEHFRGKYPDLAWATLSLPFDREDDVTYIATCHYLSPVVREFWQKELGGMLQWYATTLEGLSDAIDHLRKPATSQP